MNVVTLEDSDLPIHFKDLSIFSDRPNDFEKVYQINIEKGEGSNVYIHTRTFICVHVRVQTRRTSRRELNVSHMHANILHIDIIDITYGLYVT